MRALLLAGPGLLGAVGCTATIDASLGEDRPRLHAEPEADGAIDIGGLFADGAVIPRDATDGARATPGSTGVSEAGQVRDRDAAVLVDAHTDAAVAGCTLYGHRPFDGLPEPTLPTPSTSLPTPGTSLPKPDEWDGGVPPRFGDPPSGLPLGFEAGVPPFCCTLTTPWYCAPP